MHRSAAAVKIQRDLKEITQETVEGVLCQLIDDASVFQWRIWIQGPGDSPYEGGIFQAIMIFPEDYPMSPPQLTIQSEFWHPNVFPDGRVCISILHPPGNDPHSDERPEERWMPTQTVTTIMLSFLSLLSDPNIGSAANVDASVEWRDRRPDYLARCKNLSDKANKLTPDSIKTIIPHPDTDEVQRLQRIQKQLYKETEVPFSLYDDEFNDSGDLEEFVEDDYSEPEEIEYVFDDDDEKKEEEKNDEKVVVSTEKVEIKSKTVEEEVVVGDAGGDDGGLKRKRDDSDSDDMPKRRKVESLELEI